jgi:hypothetical protein
MVTPMRTQRHARGEWDWEAAQAAVAALARGG